MKWCTFASGTIVIGAVGVYAGYVLYKKHENRPTQQSGYYGFSLGIDKKTALYVGGTPSHVLNSTPNLPITYTPKKIPSGKTLFSYSIWEYDHIDDTNVSVSFDPKSGTLTKITCFHSGMGNGSCSPVLGIRIHTPEKHVVERLGQPNQASIKNGIKVMHYNKLNLVLRLDSHGVFEISITNRAHSAAY